MWTSIDRCPYRIYRATGKSVCQRCLVLDLQCFPDDEAKEIENSLNCSCAHEWIYCTCFNDSAITEHTKAGWELGISASGIPCLEICQPELLSLIYKAESAKETLEKETEKINVLFYGPKRNDIDPNEVLYWHNVKMSEAIPFQNAQRESRRTQLAVWNYVENHLRDCKGLPRIGEGWLNETRLFYLIKKIFPNDNVIHHYRAPWLDRLELDVYVIEKNIGFEYQGIQHFEPQEHWGGIEAFERGQERDAKKRKLCEEHGTCLIEVRYNEEVTEELVRKKLNEAFSNIKTLQK